MQRIVKEGKNNNFEMASIEMLSALWFISKVYLHMYSMPRISLQDKDQADNGTYGIPGWSAWPSSGREVFGIHSILGPCDSYY